MKTKMTTLILGLSIATLGMAVQAAAEPAASGSATVPASVTLESRYTGGNYITATYSFTWLGNGVIHDVGPRNLDSIGMNEIPDPREDVGSHQKSSWTVVPVADEIKEVTLDLKASETPTAYTQSLRVGFGDRTYFDTDNRYFPTDSGLLQMPPKTRLQDLNAQLVAQRQGQFTRGTWTRVRSPANSTPLRGTGLPRFMDKTRQAVTDLQAKTTLSGQSGAMSF